MILGKFLSLIWIALFPQLWPYPGPGVSGTGVVSYYYGYGCSGTTTNTCTVGGTTQNGLTTFTNGNDVINVGSNAAGYTIKSCGIYISAVDATNKNGLCALYSTGVNGTVLCTSSVASTLSVGWNENTSIAGCGTLPANANYTLGWQFNGSGTTVVYNTGTSHYGYHGGTTYGTFPSGTPWNPSTSYYSFFIRVTAN